jgi:hypothetical protein
MSTCSNPDKNSQPRGIAPVPVGVAFEAAAGDVRLPYPDVLFSPTSDAKQSKNRLHMCLRPSVQADEVARLEGLGTVRVDIGQSAEPGATWIVMADPEGKEFCVLWALNAAGH